MMKLASVKNVDLNWGHEVAVPEGAEVHVGVSSGDPGDDILNKFPYEVNVSRSGNRTDRSLRFSTLPEANAYIDRCLTATDFFYAHTCELLVYKHWVERLDGDYMRCHHFMSVSTYKRD